MFLLIVLAGVGLLGFFIAGALSKMTKPQPVAFEPVREESQKAKEAHRREMRARWDEPKVWDSNLPGVNVKAKPTKSMGLWD